MQLIRGLTRERARSNASCVKQHRVTAVVATVRVALDKYTIERVAAYKVGRLGRLCAMRANGSNNHDTNSQHTNLVIALLIGVKVTNEAGPRMQWLNTTQSSVYSPPPCARLTASGTVSRDRRWSCIQGIFELSFSYIRSMYLLYCMPFQLLYY